MAVETLLFRCYIVGTLNLCSPGLFLTQPAATAAWGSKTSEKVFPDWRLHLPFWEPAQVMRLPFILAA